MRRGSGLALATLLIVLASCSSPSEPIPVPANSNLSGTVSLVARDGTRAPGVGIGVFAWQCSPGTNPGGERGNCVEVTTGDTRTDAQGAYSLLGLYAGTARIFAVSPPGYPPFETHPFLAPGPNVLNIDIHQN